MSEDVAALFELFPQMGLSKEESIDELSQYLKELESQTDRGAAVLAAAFLEWRVRQSIAAAVKVRDKLDRILGTDDVGGELGFTDQCRLAYCLGLVGPIGLKDLEDVGRIRNRFAHQMGIRSFADDRVRERCLNLKSPGQFNSLVPNDVACPDPADPRKRYLSTVALLNAMLWCNGAAAAAADPETTKVIHHLAQWYYW
jgi:hypothetical protein